ncbi:MAG: CBS domain-containing protein [Rhizobiales bacterium]|nr:CBS domain-containing protein [Hyphomicrobiales bacterium]MBI3672701.1 CBS domain-containing protein [Hyphomicrobiales bacterium]
MSIQSILSRKGSKVVTLAADVKVGVAAHRLRLDGIGAVVVTGAGGALEGVLSERDIVHGLTEHGAAVTDLPVSALMTRHVVTCRPDASVRDVMRLMTQHRIRHVPVVDNGILRGIVSIGDVVKSRLEDMEMETNVLHDYVVAKA